VGRGGTPGHNAPAHGAAHSISDPSNLYANGNQYADTDGNGNRYADTDSDPNTDGDGNQYTDADSHQCTNADTNSHEEKAKLEGEQGHLRPEGVG
jgi:hypothetical protein